MVVSWSVDYRIEKLSSQNIHLLVPLYREVFQQTITLSFLLKKYNTRSLGVEFIGFIALTSEDTVAAYYGVIPCLFDIDGNSMLAAQSADTMTHPLHRKKGLFQLLALRTYDLAREQNIQFIFGFPNQNSISGFTRLKWQFLPDQLQVFILNSDGFGYSRLLRKSRTLFSVYKIMVGFILGKEVFSESFFERQNIDGIRHDHFFISYKTYNTTHIVTIGTITVWFKVDGKLKIGMVKGINAANVSGFLIEIKKIASRLGCNEVVFMASKTSALYLILSKKLTPQDAFPIGFLPLQNVSIDFKHVCFVYCDLDIF